MTNHDQFICLIQGRASEINNFEILKSKYTKVIYLAWDFKPLENKVADYQYFLPKSTWAEGRNFLLQKSLEKFPDFQYVIFIDGDLKISKGNFLSFIDFLDKYKPHLGLPLSNQIKETFRYIPDCKIQTQVSFDQVMQAYSKKVVTDKVCLPFDTRYDELSWWYSCEINQYLSTKYYGDSVLQFNELEIENSHHSDSNEVAVTNSQYRGGVTKSGKKECKKYLTKKFGNQNYLIGTLFHPDYLPRPSEANILAMLDNRKHGENSVRKDLKLLIRIMGLPYKALLKAIFSKRFPTARRIL